MLNSTLFANTRTLCCILETYQNDDHITVPKILVPYFGKDRIELYTTSN
jgi:seryl-tRNA synthetase